jgi:hypothetical protein
MPRLRLICIFFLLYWYLRRFYHVGIGYILLAALVLGTGNELVKANAMKNLLVLIYVPSPFSFLPLRKC